MMIDDGQKGFRCRGPSGVNVLVSKGLWCTRLPARRMSLRFGVKGFCCKRVSGVDVLRIVSDVKGVSGVKRVPGDFLA